MLFVSQEPGSWHCSVLAAGLWDCGDMRSPPLAVPRATNLAYGKLRCSHTWLSAVAFRVCGSRQDGCVAQESAVVAAGVRSCGMWSSEYCFLPLTPLALAVLWRLRTLGTREAIQALCTPAEKKHFALTGFLLTPETRTSQILTYHPFFFSSPYFVPCPAHLPQFRPDQCSHLRQPPAFLLLPPVRHTCGLSPRCCPKAQLPQSSAPQPGLTPPASPGQEGGSWSSPWLLGSGRCFLPSRSPCLALLWGHGLRLCPLHPLHSCPSTPPAALQSFALFSREARSREPQPQLEITSRHGSLMHPPLQKREKKF